jgi:hypothetical protein
MVELLPTRDNVLAVVTARFDDPELALAWFENEPLPGFSSWTAAQLVNAGRGADVLDYIAAVDAGVYV